MKKQEINSCISMGAPAQEAGFTIIELMIVTLIIMVIAVMAIMGISPALQNAKYDAAMRELITQIRQAREYAITNRRYIQITFPTVGSRPQVVITQMNTLTPGAGAVNPVISTVTIEGPGTYLVPAGLPDTPDAFGNGGSIYFEGLIGGPVGGMLFQSDGELVDGTTYLPINGSVFMASATQATSGRAITVLGTTGRIRGWKSSGASWAQF